MSCDFARKDMTVGVCGVVGSLVVSRKVVGEVVWSESVCRNIGADWNNVKRKAGSTVRKRSEERWTGITMALISTQSDVMVYFPAMRCTERDCATREHRMRCDVQSQSRCIHDERSSQGVKVISICDPMKKKLKRGHIASSYHRPSHAVLSSRYALPVRLGSTIAVASTRNRSEYKPIIPFPPRHGRVFFSDSRSLHAPSCHASASSTVCRRQVEALVEAPLVVEGEAA